MTLMRLVLEPTFEVDFTPVTKALPGVATATLSMDHPFGVMTMLVAAGIFDRAVIVRRPGQVSISTRVPIERGWLRSGTWINRFWGLREG